MIIVVMVLMSVTLDFIQEFHAGRVAHRLRQSVQVRARVLPDGTPKGVPATHVVPGDIVLLQAGSLVPADGLLLEVRDLFVNQALLTGESFPAEKNCEPVAGDRTDLAAATNALFMGTSAISGTATLLVCRTGAGTALGEIADTLAIAPPPTAFELGMRRFGMLIMRLTVLMVLFVLMVNTATHKPLPESFLFAIALALVGVALWLPATALGGYFGFRAPPAEFFAILAALTLGHLVIVESAKRIFFAARSPGVR